VASPEHPSQPSQKHPPKHPLKAAFRLSLLLHNLNKEAERRAGLSIVQWTILEQLMEMPGVSALELSDAVNLHPSTLTQALKRLIRKGFIVASEDPRDSRKKVVALTRQGKLALDRAGGEMEKLAFRLSTVQNELDAIEKQLWSLRVP
jgi:DNA-binding MarR family transcriptional regulator